MFETTEIHELAALCLKRAWGSMYAFVKEHDGAVLGDRYPALARRDGRFGHPSRSPRYSAFVRLIDLLLRQPLPAT